MLSAPVPAKPSQFRSDIFKQTPQSFKFSDTKKISLENSFTVCFEASVQMIGRYQIKNSDNEKDYSVGRDRHTDILTENSGNPKIDTRNNHHPKRPQIVFLFPTKNGLPFFTPHIYEIHRSYSLKNPR